MQNILPVKAQLGEEVTFEIGTTEIVKARVEAVKFYVDGDVTYDLVIATSPGGEPISEIQDVHSSLVNCIRASIWQSAQKETAIG